MKKYIAIAVVFIMLFGLAGAIKPGAGKFSSFLETKGESSVAPASGTVSGGLSGKEEEIIASVIDSLNNEGLTAEETAEIRALALNIKELITEHTAASASDAAVWEAAADSTVALIDSGEYSDGDLVLAAAQLIKYAADAGVAGMIKESDYPALVSRIKSLYAGGIATATPSDSGDNPGGTTAPSGTSAGAGGDVNYPVYGPLTVQFTDEGVVILSCDKSASGELVIPAEINGQKVIRIKESAFWECAGLTSITLPDTLREIGSRAFYGCTGLGSIRIPASVTHVGESLFMACDLESIEVDPANRLYHSAGNCLIDTKEKAVICGCKNSVIPADGSVVRINYCAFYGCKGLKEIAIPAPVTTIISYAFHNCPGVESIKVGQGNAVYRSEGNCLIRTEDNEIILGCKNSVIPRSGVSSIKYEAFENCTGLESITIPGNIRSVGLAAFRGCSSLKKVIIEEGVVTLTDAFLDCVSLSDITLADSAVNTGEAFRNTAYYNNKANWENGVLYCGRHLLEADDTVQGEYAVKDGTVSVSSAAFSGCAGLTAVDIPDSVTLICSDAFSYCTALRTVRMGSGIRRIDSHAFPCYMIIYTTAIRPAGTNTVLRDEDGIKLESCPNLKYVIYNGTEAGWNKIEIHESNDALINAEKRFAPEKKPDISIVNYSEERRESYKATLTFTADVENAPDKSSIQWFINGKYAGSGETYTVKQATADYKVQVKLVGADTKVIAESETETVHIDSGFFARIIAFFKSIFRLLDNIIQ